jgi:hypothetical protein
MEGRELAHVVVAVLMMFVVSSMAFILKSGSFSAIGSVFIFSVIVVGVPVLVKKSVAYLLDSSVEHEVWSVRRYGFREKNQFRKGVPFGILVPLFFSILTLGLLKVMTFLTYETRALKHRAAKRFGFYSYTSMTDWHNGLIGASGIVALWVIAVIGYLPGWEFMAKMAAYYAFWNMVPIAKLDGSQIFFGNRILWVVLGVITLIFAFYGFVLGV